MDLENEPDVIALTGASAALHISPIPFMGPVAAVRVGRINGEYVINPTSKQLLESDINMVVAGSREAVVMVEGGARFVSEAAIAEAIDAAHRAILPILDAQEELRKMVGNAKEAPPAVEEDQELIDSVRRLAVEEMRAVMTTPEKFARRDRKKALKLMVKQELAENFPDRDKEISETLEDIEKEVVREQLVKEGRRIDGRKPDEIRNISVEVGGTSQNTWFRHLYTRRDPGSGHRHPGIFLR